MHHGIASPVNTAREADLSRAATSTTIDPMLAGQQHCPIVHGRRRCAEKPAHVLIASCGDELGWAVHAVAGRYHVTVRRARQLVAHAAVPDAQRPAQMRQGGLLLPVVPDDILELAAQSDGVPAGRRAAARDRGAPQRDAARAVGGPADGRRHDLRARSRRQRLAAVAAEAARQHQPARARGTLPVQHVHAAPEL
eukprot:1891748-Prymnesium_polylepis.3